MSLIGETHPWTITIEGTRDITSFPLHEVLGMRLQEAGRPFGRSDIRRPASVKTRTALFAVKIGRIGPRSTTATFRETTVL